MMPVSQPQIPTHQVWAYLGCDLQLQLRSATASGHQRPGACLPWPVVPGEAGRSPLAVLRGSPVIDLTRRQRARPHPGSCRQGALRPQQGRRQARGGQRGAPHAGTAPQLSLPSPHLRPPPQRWSTQIGSEPSNCFFCPAFCLC